MVRGKKGKGWLKIMGNRTACAAAAAGAVHICSLLLGKDCTGTLKQNINNLAILLASSVDI